MKKDVCGKEKNFVSYTSYVRHKNNKMSQKPWKIVIIDGMPVVQILENFFAKMGDINGEPGSNPLFDEVSNLFQFIE